MSLFDSKKLELVNFDITLRDAYVASYSNKGKEYHGFVFKDFGERDDQGRPMVRVQTSTIRSRKAEILSWHNVMIEWINMFALLRLGIVHVDRLLKFWIRSGTTPDEMIHKLYRSNQTVLRKELIKPLAPRDIKITDITA